MLYNFKAETKTGSRL